MWTATGEYNDDIYQRQANQGMYGDLASSFVGVPPADTGCTNGQCAIVAGIPASVNYDAYLNPNTMTELERSQLPVSPYAQMYGEPAQSQEGGSGFGATCTGMTQSQPVVMTAQEKYMKQIGGGVGSQHFKESLAALVDKLGPPSLYDKKEGGIALWNQVSLTKKSFPFLKRVELIDENVRCHAPQKHFCNLYLHYKVHLSDKQARNLTLLSDNFHYDHAKRICTVRCPDFTTGINLASLVKRYARGEVSYYSMNSYDLSHHFNGGKRLYRESLQIL